MSTRATRSYSIIGAKHSRAADRPGARARQLSRERADRSRGNSGAGGGSGKGKRRASHRSGLEAYPMPDI